MPPENPKEEGLGRHPADLYRGELELLSTPEETQKLEETRKLYENLLKLTPEEFRRHWEEALATYANLLSIPESYSPPSTQPGLSFPHAYELARVLANKLPAKYNHYEFKTLEASETPDAKVED